MSDNNSSQLTAAAEALVRAAVSKMNASVIAMDCEVVQGIQSIATDLKGRNDDEKTLEALEASVGLLNGKVNTLNSTISQMQNTMCSIDKHRRIEFALIHCNFDMFAYSDSDCSNHRSEHLAKTILLYFRKGYGYCTSLDMILDPHCSSNDEKLKSNQKFRDALTARSCFRCWASNQFGTPCYKPNRRRVIRYP
jgi:hypothetical protein